MKRGELVVVTFVLAIMLVGIVSASGVSCSYWDGKNANPLKMYEGQITTTNLNLQNMVGDDDVTYSVAIKEGSDIASLIQGVYTVRAHTSDTMVPLRISVPDDAKVGDTTKVIVEFKSITSGTGGMVTMGTGMSVSFDVVVVEKPEGLPIAWIVAGIVVLIIAIWMVSVSRKKRKK